MSVPKIPHGYVLSEHIKLVEKQAYRNDFSPNFELEEVKPIQSRSYRIEPAEFQRYAYLEYCLRKEFDEKLKKQQEEIQTLKKALADTLAALAAK